MTSHLSAKGDLTLTDKGFVLVDYTLRPFLSSHNTFHKNLMLEKDDLFLNIRLEQCQVLGVAHQDLMKADSLDQYRDYQSQYNAP
jgi:hypothetical protein